MPHPNILDESLELDPAPPQPIPILEQGLVVMLAVVWLVHYLPGLAYNWLRSANLETYLRVGHIVVCLMGMAVALSHVRPSAPAVLRRVAFGFLLLCLPFLAQIFFPPRWPTWIGQEIIGGIVLVLVLILVATIKRQQQHTALVWGQLLLLAYVYLSNQLLLNFLVDYQLPQRLAVWVQSPVWLLAAWVFLQIDPFKQWSTKTGQERLLMGAFTFAVGSLWSARIWVLQTWEGSSMQRGPSTFQYGTWALAWLFCLIFGLALVVYYKNQKQHHKNP